LGKVCKIIDFLFQGVNLDDDLLEED